jgi:hypothetical protein
MLNDTDAVVPLVVFVKTKVVSAVGTTATDPVAPDTVPTLGLIEIASPTVTSQDNNTCCPGKNVSRDAVNETIPA